MKNPFTPLGKRGRAKRISERAGELRDAGKKAEAIASYQRAMAIDPSWSVPFYNLGLLHKYEGEWQASLEATRRATELDPKDEASWWNLGIAATALGRWDVARTAWLRAGLKLPQGTGPIDYPCGSNPIRLAPAGEMETVWADRLDPARARLSNIPLGAFCFGDVVLNDGAPTGYRKRRGEDVPVFDCLALLEPSPLATWCVEITLEEPKRKKDAPGPFDHLDIIARERGLAAENWTTSVRTLCKACSAGRPHDHHDEPRFGEGEPVPQRIAIAARTRGEVHDLLADWDAEGRGAIVGDIQMEFSHA
ncbi:MAG: hypothetical protein K0R38_6167 [Polyangiaceae bacterium]|jgi:hypothetical protein|nr:hypothetical protein [Polyangiaceae bacterium]